MGFYVICILHYKFLLAQEQLFQEQTQQLQHKEKLQQYQLEASGHGGHGHAGVVLHASCWGDRSEHAWITLMYIHTYMLGIVIYYQCANKNHSNLHISISRWERLCFVYISFSMESANFSKYELYEFYF